MLWWPHITVMHVEDGRDIFDLLLLQPSPLTRPPSFSFSFLFTFFHHPTHKPLIYLIVMDEPPPPYRPPAPPASSL